MPVYEPISAAQRAANAADEAEQRRRIAWLMRQQPQPTRGPSRTLAQHADLAKRMEERRARRR